jgi:Flp pilus assembly protein TadD
MGLACARARLYPRAEMVLRRAVELRPEYAPGHYELGRAFFAQEKNDLARRAFTRFLELDPASPRRAAVEEALRHMERSEAK